ncbi:RICIN domain-containing protein [Aureisphaera sp. CAU 1614]|uniref:RICIN domain-containing protein n=1 Tax=Halomarinibacterium sedimenti TaxID=2857106 RepID=A0A9X1FNK3_9FLAO|nr:RICIN domain-containing protein [Halomarinibacterium sedimenti]MBW2937762.1 RICIN domain-containing protein [Halomarinibacterium sedimenti]
MKTSHTIITLKKSLLTIDIGLLQYLKILLLFTFIGLFTNCMPKANETLMRLTDKKVMIKNSVTNNFLTVKGNQIVLEPLRNDNSIDAQIYRLSQDSIDLIGPVFYLNKENNYVKSGEDSFQFVPKQDGNLDYAFQGFLENSIDTTNITLIRPLALGDIKFKTDSVNAPNKYYWSDKGALIALDVPYKREPQQKMVGAQNWQMIDAQVLLEPIEAKLERERIANIPVIDTSKVYIIRVKHSGKALDYGGHVYQWTMHGGRVQQWKISYAGNQEYYLKNIHLNQYMTINDGSTEYGASVVLANKTGGAEQRFKLINNLTDWRIINVKSGLTLDLSGGTVQLNDGQPIVQYQWHTGDNQKFEIFPAVDVEFYKERNPTIKFYNESGYLAQYKVYYNNSLRHSTNDVALWGDRSFEIPARAKNIRIIGTGTGIGSVFDLNIILYGEDYCIKTYGSIFKSYYNNDCEPWNPFADSTVHVTNLSGEKIYVGWSNEPIWGLTNMTAGVLTGLIIDNMQNLNANYYKLIAVASATDLALPKEAYELFQDAAIEIENDNFKPIIEHSPLGTLLNFIDIYSGAKEFALKLIGETIEQTDEYKAKYINYNPILAIGDMAGAETKTIMAVNESLTKFWVVDTGIDDSWIITPTEVYKSKYGTLRVKDENDPRTQSQVAPNISN